MRQSVSFGVIKYFRSRERWLSHNTVHTKWHFNCSLSKVNFLLYDFHLNKGKKLHGHHHSQLPANLYLDNLWVMCKGGTKCITQPSCQDGHKQ